MKRIPIEARMGRYQQELVRWNRQINLVSRKGTLGLVATLIRQCRDAFSVLQQSELSVMSADRPFWYFDLGSGGGLPGYVWHSELSAVFPLLRTWLVEPREKRAWFLDRLNHIDPESPVHVVQGLWGAQRVPEEGLDCPGSILLSLKALRLSDEVVLTGLADAVSGVCEVSDCRVLIARFYPPGQTWDKSLNEELAPFTTPTECGGLVFEPAGQAVLAPQGRGQRPASLVVSRYKILP